MSEAKFYKICLQIHGKTPEYLYVYSQRLCHYETLDMKQILVACIHLHKHCPELIAEYRDAYFEYKEATK